MSTFLRLLTEPNKSAALSDACTALRSRTEDSRIFQVAPESFRSVPNAPFCYWVSEEIRQTFQRFDLMESPSRHVALGLSTKYDFRFVRCYWEVAREKIGRKEKWICYANGGYYSRFYYHYPALVNGFDDFVELRAYLAKKFPYLAGRIGWVLHDENDYVEPAITWPLRTHTFSPHYLPEGFVFSARTYAVCTSRGDIPALLGLMASRAVDWLLKVSLGRSGHPEFVTSTVRNLPFPPISSAANKLSKLSRRAWSLKRTLDSVEETSRAFLLPAVLRKRLGDFDPPAVEAELVDIQSEIDDIAFDLYGFNDADRAVALGPTASADHDEGHAVEDPDDSEGDDVVTETDQTDGLLSWAVGVAFGRFDLRLATGEREAPSEPDPFDPLPAKSSGMLPDDAAPFHGHNDILVDEQGHPHDLSRIIEEVLSRVDVDVQVDVRRWLQRDFFPLHLKQYSKSRRKSPIYWPLSTSSGSYTLWVYYPSLTTQTLYTSVNDFVEPKLKQVARDTADLREKGSGRSRDDEKAFEALQSLELELIELRDTLLQIAPTYRPNHDDGVQITAAPLWQLFKHKPWQKVLKDTWTKLEKGDYDWAHLAMAYWPDRVRAKCHTDKSLAIAHDLIAQFCEDNGATGLCHAGTKR